MNPHANSLNGLLATMDVGDQIYQDTTLQDYQGVQRRVTAASRFPESMDHMRFSSSLFTAVSAATAGDIRYLVCIKRVK